MSRTKIGWVKSPDGSQGCSLNSKTGCLNHTLEGLCLGGLFPCYAFRLANGRLRQRYLANKNIARLPFPQGGEYGVGHLSTALADPFYPRFWPERLKEPYRIKKPSGFFLDDMSDWMGDYWPREWKEAELQMMSDNPQHRIYTLTKQAQNLLRWSPFPANCWVGVTATDYESFYFGAIKYLVSIRAKVKYISFEPLLSGFGRHIPGWLTACLIDAGIGWVIIGACTGTWGEMANLCLRYGELTLTSWGNRWTAQPKMEWVQEIVKVADKAGIPVFLKENLVPMIADSLDPAKLKLYPDGMHLRQEVPK